MSYYSKLILYFFKVAWIIANASAESTPSYFVCPPVNQTIQVPASQGIRLPRASNGFLCTLSRITIGYSSAPVARSYDGNDWERVAGPYRTLPINCSQEYCDLLIPSANTSTTGFFLASFDRLLPSIDIVARFLEQTTFGTTRADIEAIRVQSNNFLNLPGTLADWVSNQINIVKMTSHREFFRGRMASRTVYQGHEGAPTHPCQANSQWRRASFTDKDSLQVIQTTQILGRFPIYVNGNLRTVVDINFFQFNNMSFDVKTVMNFTICPGIEDFVGGRFSLKIGEQSNCVSLKNGNPPINFTSSDPQPRVLVTLPAYPYVVVTRSMINSIPENIYISSNLSSEICKTIPLMACCNGQGSVFGLMSTGQFMIFDPRLLFRANTIDAPLYDGGGSTVLATDSSAQCANTPRTFLNEKNCYMSTASTACSSSTVPDVSISLNTSTILSFFKASSMQLYIYVIDGLRIQDDSSVTPPCLSGKISRWRRQQSGVCNTNVQNVTAALFQQLISQSSDNNPNIRDIYLPSELSCHSLDIARLYMTVKIGSECWSSTHPDNLNVYDFTYWTLEGTHPGNLGITNPISKFAMRGSSILMYPQNHPMDRWQINKNIFPLIGRFNDTLAFSDLPDYLRQNYIAVGFGLSSDSIYSGRIVCGSPGEIANQVESFASFDVARSPERDTTSGEDFVQQRKTVWTTIAIQSPDQLRQRMAWALSQLLPISPLSNPNTEIYLYYYDIFVRNAFSNYRNILREVAFSPLMGKMLTYLGSQSQAYTLATIHELKYPDENFAREIMQLFSIGLVQLEPDGTPLVDDDGNFIRTYTNDAVMEYSRVWTGFIRQQARGNYEERLGISNNIDPMTININKRDQYPKLGLNDQYVGDKYMLCSDLPPRSFLRAGATYRLLGSSYIPESSTLNVVARGSQSLKVFELNHTSALFRILCGQGGRWNCTTELAVTLGQSVPCFGNECLIDMIQVVKLTGNLYYEYIRPACVNFPFFNSGSTTVNQKGTSSQCVDNRRAVAAELCCSSTNAISNSCMFSGERVDQATARARCNARSMILCSTLPSSFFRGNCWNYNGNFWLNKTCSVGILVSPDGKIAIESGSTNDYPEEMNTFFRVLWRNGSFPSLENSCGAGLCSSVGRLCLCTTFVIDKAVFTKIPSRLEALSLLNVGAVPPTYFDNGKYTLTDTTPDGLWVYQASKSIDNTTVFKVQDLFGRILFLRNLQSMVHIRGSNGFFTANSIYGFRNPPLFYDGTANKGDALYETEAALDHYFYHKNTATFVAMNLIQKFGVSNPSPRFIQLVSTAFKMGSYTFMDNAFGTGLYGDLGATIASIILDRESRSVVLDNDSSFGSLREPLIKVISLMRSLEFKTSSPFIVLKGLYSKIGQNAHDFPSVFSFFLPQYSPPTLVQSSLYSPEAMLLTHNIGLMNGMISLIKFGLNSCFNGFGVSKDPICDSNVTDENTISSGWLRYSSSNPRLAIDELATILTSGRMPAHRREIIAQTYNFSNNGLRAVEQLFLSSPEFHSTGLVRSNGENREKRSVPGTCKPYKAIVHILLKGGCDTYNMIVPLSQCQDVGKDLYEQYRTIRGTVALAKESLLPIQVDGNTQPCAVFGIHPSLSSLKTIYEEGEALFIANIGVLNRPVTKSNYLQQTSTNLFAHDAMQAEITRLDPFQVSTGTGFLGRIVDYLYDNDYKLNAFTVDSPLTSVSGENPVETKYSVESSSGFLLFDPSSVSDALMNQTRKLNDKTSVLSSVFAELWSSSLQNAIDSNKNLFWANKRGNVSTVFPSTDVGNQLKLVAQMINSNDCRRSDRDVFYIEVPGYDHHDSVLSSLQSRFDELNDGITAFVAEMKLRNKWNDVTIVSTSDFGRTLVANSNEGTDHAWAGHSFLLGGSVRGKRILGQYPPDLSDDSPLSVGRGRFIPSLPWEAVFNAVAQWMDINEDSALDTIFPNRRLFASSLFRKAELFNESRRNFPACSRRLIDSVTCENLSSSVNTPSSENSSTSSQAGESPPGAPLRASPVPDTDGNGVQESNYSSHGSNGRATDINVTGWLVPILLLTAAFIVAGFYRRKLNAFIGSRIRYNRQAANPRVVFLNATNPNDVEVETGKTVNIFEDRPDLWASYS